MDTRNILAAAWNEIFQIRDAMLVEDAVTLLSGYPSAIKTIAEKEIPCERHIAARQSTPAGFYITPPETGVNYVLVFVSGRNVTIVMYLLANGTTVALRDNVPVSELYELLSENNLSSVAGWARPHANVLPFGKCRVISKDHMGGEVVREGSLAMLIHLLDNKMAAALAKAKHPPVTKPNKKELITQLLDLIVDEEGDSGSIEERLTRIENQLERGDKGDLSERVRRLESAREQDAVKYEKLVDRHDKLVETLSKLQDTLNRMLVGDE